MQISTYVYLICAIGCIAICTCEIPEAAHQETLNQRHIAKLPVNGFYQYAQFVENNK